MRPNIKAGQAGRAPRARQAAAGAAAAILALALAALPAAAGAQAAKKPDVVALRFAWPEPLEAQVTYRSSRTRSGQPATRTTTRYVQSAARDGELVRIATTGVTWEGDSPFPAQGRKVADELLRAAQDTVQVVNADGEPVGLEGEEKLEEAMTRALSATGASAEQVARVRAALAGQLEAEAAESWNLAVGFWIGADLELGARYAMETEAAIPLLAGTTAEYRVEFGVRRRVPCTAREKAVRCVEITLRSVPDPEVLPRILPAMVERLAGSEAKLPADAIEELAIENELVLVTEPATLVPHRLVWTKAVRLVANEGERATTLEQLDRREYDYRYAAAKKPPVRKKPAAKKPAPARKPAAPPAAKKAG